MKKEIIEIIKEKVNAGKAIATAVIEYNFELPKDKDIKKDSFYGVKARFNPDMPEDTANLTYTY